MNQFSRNLALWLVLALLVLLVVNMFQGQQTRDTEIGYSQFVSDLASGRIDEVTVQGDVIRGRLDAAESFRTHGPREDAIERLLEIGVPFSDQPPADDPWYVVLLVQWFPMLLLVGVWIFFMRQMQMGGGKAMAFGKNRAKLLNENSNKLPSLKKSSLTYTSKLPSSVFMVPLFISP